MIFQEPSNKFLLERLEIPDGKIHVVIDTDTYNEVDDQFALAYALRSPEKLCVEAVYAAPFFNDRSSSPKDGMEKSYDEIINVMKMLDFPTDGIVFHGSTGYLENNEIPHESDAVRDLVNRAMEQREGPLYVIALAAITNIASAILLEPQIIDKIVIVWLGGHALNWPDTREFNLMQDPVASKIILDSVVPLIHIPCMGVTSHLLTTIPELEYYLMGKSEIGTYLTEIVKSYSNMPFGWSKVIWDVAAVAWLINANWVKTSIVHSPILTNQLTWSFDSNRHFIRSATHILRDNIFGDLFMKLSV